MQFASIDSGLPPAQAVGIWLLRPTNKLLLKTGIRNASPVGNPINLGLSCCDYEKSVSLSSAKHEHYGRTVRSLIRLAINKRP